MDVFITGGTGYMGRRLIPQLIPRGHAARAPVPARAVLGRGHRCPYLFLPLYWLFGLFPSRRPTVRRLGLVTIRQMTHALAWVVEHPPPGGARVMEVPEIRTTRPGAA